MKKSNNENFNNSNNTSVASKAYMPS